MRILPLSFAYQTVCKVYKAETIGENGLIFLYCMLKELQNETTAYSMQSVRLYRYSIG
jgi:hypothetical protein